jgi:hypothetical protein
MNARFDRVIRRATAGGKKVYSLNLNSDGLYIFYTGIVGGLVFDNSDGKPRMIVVDDQTMPLIESMIKNEARAQSVPPDELVKEDGHELILFTAITAVREDGLALIIVTTTDIFDLYFTLSKDTEIAELADRLRHASENAHADH